MNTLNKNEKNALFILIIVGIVILTYGYKFDFLYGKVDTGYYELGEYRNFSRYLFLWNNNASLGELYSLFFARFFVQAYISLLSLFFNNIYQVNFLGLFLLNLSFPIVTFFFLQSFTDKRDKNFTAIIAMFSLISLLNIHFLQTNINPLQAMRFDYVFFCILIILINHYIKSAKKSTLLLLLLVVLLSNINWNLFQFWIPYVILIFSYTLFLLFTGSIDFRKFLTGWLVFLLLNLPSLFSIFFYTVNTPLGSTEAFRYADIVYSFANKNSNLTNLTAFIGGTNWNQNWEWNDVPVYLFSRELSTNVFLLICRYSIFFLFLFNVLNSKQKNKKDNFILVVILITMFMIASYNPPFGRIFEFLYKSNPFMKIFRESHNKFYQILLLGLFLYISKNFTSNRRTIRVTYAILAIYLVGFFYITLRYSLYSPDSFFKVPDEYGQISKQIKNKERLLILPSYDINQIFSYDLYGRNPFDFMIDNPIVSLSQVLESNNNRKATIKVLDDFNPENLKSFFFVREGEPSYDVGILRKYGIKYVILDSNIIGYPAFTSEDFKLLSEKFTDNEDYNLISKSGSLAFYEIVDTEDSYFDTNLVNYKIINPTKYIVEITMKSDKEELIFKQSYDKNWKMYPIDTSINTTQIKNNFLKDILFLTKKDVQGENHISNDYYLNQWNIDLESYREETGDSYVIDNRDGSSTIKFILYYKPQSYMYLALIISGLSFISAISYVIFMPKQKIEPVSVVE